MNLAYMIVTVVAAFFTGSAAVFYLIGHEYPKTQADMKGIPRRYVPVLGLLLAAGSVGLLTGFALPAVGTAAAVGLVLYFTGALIAHLRVGSRNLVGWAIFYVTVLANLALNLAESTTWW
ncbi:DoxX family protein [Actinoplanes derwentensis]|uniref:DoxX-like family protein n=1 Tax=Actinoplanes derwentensis TaxID=113562 RepID=A0A1H1WRN7_9ACTN|nr:DoxX family protein [Actinoplanes derwentensis]GID86991.1 membrane protein [Actinoplanes derwentensis]SDS99938.1 DoxX-like family protein [Actinoplanes derwentensis]